MQSELLPEPLGRKIFRGDLLFSLRFSICYSTLSILRLLCSNLGVLGRNPGPEGNVNAGLIAM